MQYPASTNRSLRAVLTHACGTACTPRDTHNTSSTTPAHMSTNGQAHVRAGGNASFGSNNRENEEACRKAAVCLRLFDATAVRADDLACKVLALESVKRAAAEMQRVCSVLENEALLKG